MTREEAIVELKTRYLTMSQCVNKAECRRANQALNMAIKALEQEPSISEDGTLTVNFKDDKKVNRVLVCGDSPWGGLYYPEQEPIIDKIRAEIAMYEADCRLQGGTDECEKCNSNVFGSIYRILDKYKAESEGKKNEIVKTCPFCGSDDIGVKDSILEHKMGQDCPCSTLRKVWSYCRRCGCEGRKTTIDSVYDSEIIAAATEAWNRRAYEID